MNFWCCSFCVENRVEKKVQNVFILCVQVVFNTCVHCVVQLLTTTLKYYYVVVVLLCCSFLCCLCVLHVLFSRVVHKTCCSYVLFDMTSGMTSDMMYDMVSGW